MGGPVQKDRIKNRENYSNERDEPDKQLCKNRFSERKRRSSVRGKTMKVNYNSSVNWRKWGFPDMGSIFVRGRKNPVQKNLAGQGLFTVGKGS